MIRHEHHDSVCFIPCHSDCFGNSAGRIYKKRHERRENFFVQSSDTVRKPDLQGYACRQRRTDDMEKICGTNADFLESLGVRNYDVCIVAIGNNFQSSLETTSLLSELGARFVVSRAATDVQEKFLLRNGANEVVYPEKQLAKWTAIRYSADHILDYIELDENHAMFEIPIPKDWADHSIGELDIRKKFNINIMGIKKSGKLELSISSDTVLKAGDTMLALGSNRNLQKCFHT